MNNGRADNENGAKKVHKNQKSPEIIVIDECTDEGNDQDDGWSVVHSKRKIKRSQPKNAEISRKETDKAGLYPLMIILVGIPGSGKSSFTNMLTKGNPSKFERICQDVLGSRMKCQKACRKALLNGKVPVIDRCNFDTNQRFYFTQIAEEFNAHVDCIVFSFPRDVCIERCEERIGHETVSRDNARQVVGSMWKQFVSPGETIYRSLQTVTSFRQANSIASEYLQAL